VLTAAGGGGGGFGGDRGGGGREGYRGGAPREGGGFGRGRDAGADKVRPHDSPRPGVQVVVMRRDSSVGQGLVDDGRAVLIFVGANTTRVVLHIPLQP